jgi:hypothetical protein
MSRLSMLLVFASATSCAYGMTDEKFIPARTPHGIETIIRTPSIELRGELIELQDSGIVILSLGIKSASQGKQMEKQERVLRLVPYASIRHSAFSQLSRPYAISGGRAPTGKVRERLRLVSRFPYGISPEVLTQLLHANGQTTLAGLEP